MYTITINGNIPEELFANLAKLAAAKGNITPAAFSQAAAMLTPTAAQPPIAATVPTPAAINPTPAPTAAPALAPAAPTPTAAPTPAANHAPAVVAPAPTAPAAPAAAPAPAPAAVPTGAPTYTLDQLAKAGAALAQSGKMEAAIALLAKYGVQTVNQLKPEQYGPFATELRALGAQI